MSITRLKQKLLAMPVAILPTMVGAATLSTIYLTYGYTWIRNLTLWACILIVLSFVVRIFIGFDTVKKEYAQPIPASLYAGFTMLLMILGSTLFIYMPLLGKALWGIGLGIHAIHTLIFIYRYIFKNFVFDTFVPTWFVTFNGIMVSTVVGVPLNVGLIGPIVVYYGLLAFCVLFPFMVRRLILKPLPTPLAPAKVILLAPPSLCLVSYLNFIPNPQPIVVYTLYGIIILLLFYVGYNIPQIFSEAFHPGFAGVTFPMAIATVASTKMVGFFELAENPLFSSIAHQIGGIQLYITTILIGFVIYNFLRLLF